MHFIPLAGELMLSPIPAAIVLLGIFYLRRALWSKQRPGKKSRGFYPTTFSLGLAFQMVQLFAEPGQKHVVVERLQESADEDNEGDPENLTKQFDRQLQRIRRGEDVDVLKIPLNQSRFRGSAGS
jgi:hypothetical protein